MGETLIVRAIVPEDLKVQFDLWYEQEHLPEAHQAFGSFASSRGWSDERPDTHFAIYQFAEVGAVKTIAADGTLGALVDKFDDKWRGRERGLGHHLAADGNVTGAWPTTRLQSCWLGHYRAIARNSTLHNVRKWCL